VTFHEKTREEVGNRKGGWSKRSALAPIINLLSKLPPSISLPQVTKVNKETEIQYIHFNQKMSIVLKGYILE
jgi:hypothetical protein